MSPFDPEAFIERAPWRFARTMAQWPHEYVVRGKHVDGADFEAFVEHIRRHGVVGWWRRRYRNSYLTLDGWKYWAMSGASDPHVKHQDELPVDQVKIINRERLRPPVHNPMATEHPETDANDEPLPRAETAG